MKFTPLFSIDVPDPVLYLLGATPLILVIASWVLKFIFRKKETAGYGFNGNAFVKWLLMLYLLITAVNFWVAPNIPGNWIPAVGEDGEAREGMILITYFTLYCFVCYFLVSWRELTEEQREKAVGAKGLVFSLASTAAASAGAVGAGAVGVLGMIWSVIQAAAYPIVSVTANTITYVSTGIAGFFGMIAVLLPLVCIIAVAGAFLILIVLFLTAVIVWAAVVLRFLLNLRITVIGPSRVSYKVSDEDDLD